MSVFQAVIIGIIQGLTEFLPISSSAHMRVIPALLGWPDPGAAFTAVIQLGTLLAVLIYFRDDLARAFMGWVRSITNRRQAEGAPADLHTGPAPGGTGVASKLDARLGWAVFIGTIPVVLFGLLLNKNIEGHFRSLYVIAWALIVLGVLLFLSEKAAQHVRKIQSVELADGWVVGLWQALAIIPGVSRSGSSITGALFLGFDRETAARFSFLLSFPAIFLSGVYELIKERSHLAQVGAAQVAAATIAAFVVGYITIGMLLRFLRSHTTVPFVVYRIALGVLLLVLLNMGRLRPFG